MTSKQRLPVGLLLVAVIAGGLAACGGGGAAASSSPVAAVSASPAPATATPAQSAPAAESAPASVAPSSPASASPAATAAPSATPRPSAVPGEPATITLASLKLDAKDDPDGKNRRVEFGSQGTGAVTVTVKAVSPQGRAVACLSADGERLACKTTADGTITAMTRKGSADFVLTLRGEGIDTPLVDVTLSFPAVTPSLTIKNARFDGTQWPDTNGLQAYVTPRRDGDVALAADWGGHPFMYEIDLLEQGGPGSHVVANQESATRVKVSLPVTAPNPWKLVLQNTEDGMGITELDATIAWP